MRRIYFLLIFLFAWSLTAVGQEADVSSNPIDSIRHQSSGVFTNPVSAKEDLIHPNPSEGIFNLTSVTEGDDISVFDGTGRMVFNTRGEESKVKIDLTHLEKGIYLVIVRDQNKKLKVNQKVMIK
ncbi:T9SS type A sorting domain-containing protein [Cryomorphaceae bacterium 1068]|nr:T9SS type A sorting domain-containing protein [Cryomorphaceae bacterium 1068]